MTAAKVPEPESPSQAPIQTAVSHARVSAPSLRPAMGALFPPPLALETQLYLAALELPSAIRPRT